MEKLKSLYLQFIQEYANQHTHAINFTVDNMYIRKDENSFYSKIKFNINYLQVVIRREINIFQKKEQELLNQLIYEIRKTAKYNFCTLSIENSLYETPSTVNNYIINFVIRNIQLNKFYKIFTQQSFEIAFKELSIFILEEYVEYELYYPLHDCTGSINKLDFGDILIRKATLEDCNFFDNYYNYETPNNMCETDLNIGDYFAIIKRKVAKSEWQSDYNNYSRDTANHFISLLSLSSNGNIRLGRAIHKFEDWTVNNTGVSNSKSEPLPFINNPFTYSIDEAKQNIEAYYECIFTEDFRLDNPLQYALKWLKKAKQTTDINDKIVQLTLALEYSIKTNSDYITRDLKEKSAILYSYDGTNSYKITKNIIYNFYDLRSKIVHGIKDAEPTQAVLELIDKTETIIRKNLFLLCKLNQELSFEEINQFIEDVRSETPRPILKSIIKK